MANRAQKLRGFLIVLLVVGILYMLKTRGKENVVQRLAAAIGRQEGFYVSGSAAQRNNNPGNLIEEIIKGTSRGKDSSGFVIFNSPSDGWENLTTMIDGWFNGTSNFYNTSMSIAEVAKRYTTTERDYWATNVASFLGVPVTTTLGEIF